jgi:putative exporter of polyketide antibiotics
MEINQAQKDVRETFLGGFAGQLVSALLWGTSAAVCTWCSLHLGEVVLVLGGFLIFPSTQLVLRSMGHAYALPKGHPMNALGIQVAFTLPLTHP